MTSEDRIAREEERQRQAAERRMQKAKEAVATAGERARERVQREEDRMRLVTDAVVEVVGKQPWFDDFESLAQAAFEVNGASKHPYFGDRTPDKRGKAKGFVRFQRAIRSPLATEILGTQGVVVYAIKGRGAGVPGRSAVEDFYQREDLRFERQVARTNERRELANRVLGTEIPKVQVGLLTDGSGQ